MAYNISYKKSVQRDLKTISKAETTRILDKIEKELTKKAGDYPMLKGEYAGLRKFRVGDSRVIFAIMDDNVLVLQIAHRKEAYR